MPRSKPTPDAPPELLCIAEQLRPLAIDVGLLQLDPKNARKHAEKDLAAIAGSLKKYGQRVPLVVNRATGHIEKGNGTYRAAVDRLGWTHLAVVYVDDDPSTASGFALADNRTAELSEWDDSLLAEAIAELELQDADFAELLALEEFAPPDDAAAVTLPEVYGVTLDAGSEALQREVYERLIAEFPVLAKDGKIKLQTM